jgi:hypothetical protein
VFALATPGDVLSKLWWEIDQLRKSLSTQSDDGAHAPAYHAFNCAITAWHMADWIWQIAAAQDRIYLLSEFALSPTGENQRDFSLFTRALMARYRVLHICRQLATGSKHKLVERHPDPDVLAEEHWTLNRRALIRGWRSARRILRQPIRSRWRAVAPGAAGV